MAAVGFSLYLSGSLLYVRSHIIVESNVLSVLLNKPFSVLPELKYSEQCTDSKSVRLVNLGNLSQMTHRSFSKQAHLFPVPPPPPQFNKDVKVIVFFLLTLIPPLDIFIRNWSEMGSHSTPICGRLLSPIQGKVKELLSHHSKHFCRSGSRPTSPSPHCCPRQMLTNLSVIMVSILSIWLSLLHPPPLLS